jgi:hypothetical protein
MPRLVRYLLVLLVIAALSVGGWFAYVKTRPPEALDPAADKPLDPPAGKTGGRLVVLVVFDQMRGDYLARWEKLFGSGGFERMKSEGVWFANAELPYACASTGPGHASIGTGATPAVTGIIENEWFDRPSGKTVYCAQPKRPYELVPPVPASDKKASRGSGIGFSPDQLLAETVGEKLKAANGGRGKVISLSIKDRTATLMAGGNGDRKPDAVYCFDTRDGRFHTDTYYRDHPHPWVEEFNAAGVANRWAGKTWDRFRPALDYKTHSGQPNPAPGSGYGISQHLNFPHPMAEGKPAGPEYYEALETSPYGNELLFELVKKAIAAEKLGTGDAPDLLCVSFSSNDLIGHYWGPDSWEVLDVTLRADQMMADFLTYLDSSVGKDRYTLVMTADHGVCPVPEQNAAMKSARRVMMEAGNNEIYTPLTAALNERFGIPASGPTQWFAGEAREQARVWPWVYLNYRALDGRGLRPEPVAEFVRDWLAGQAFIEAAFTREELEQIDLAKADPWGIPAKVKQAYYGPRCGDVVAAVKPGVLVTTYKSGTNHGTPNAYDTHVPVVAYGSGIPRLGKRSERASSLIVAPMLARALGIDPPANAVEKVPAMLVSP